jgi:hypothetical protein
MHHQIKPKSTISKEEMTARLTKTSVYLASVIMILLHCEKLPRFTAVVVAARCVGFSDSGMG